MVPTPELSGAERVLLRYLTRARAEGWQITVLAPGERFVHELAGAQASAEPTPGPVVAATQLPDLTAPAGSRALARLRVVTRYVRAAREIRRLAGAADVIVVNGFLALPAVRLAHLTGRAGRSVPVVWLVHDVIHRPGWRLVLRACSAAITRAVAVSDAVAEPLRDVGLDVTLVRNGTPFPLPGRRPTSGVPVVGVNALLTPWKGQHVLLEAAAQLDVPARIELMGGQFVRDRAYVADLQHRIVDLALADRVSLLGHVEDPVDRMRDWTVAVSASVDPEAAPLNVLEAMSLGLPMVATNHGGTPEVLGEAGLLVPPGDSFAMAEAVRRLLTDADLYARCAAAGPRVIGAALELEEAATRFLSCLQEVVAVRRGRRAARVPAR